MKRRDVLKQEDKTKVQELAHALADLPNAQIVQIGSNDGVQGDPLHALIKANAGWKVLFVEPVPFLFERLCRNYGNESRFAFANVAIDTEPGKRPFYFVPQLDPACFSGPLPSWHTELGSFDRGHITKHYDGAFEAHIESICVDCVTLEELFAKYAVSNLDMLHIDAEGSDLMILKQVDFSRYSPTAILFEHFHLSGGDVKTAYKFLREAGYRLSVHGMDTLALKEARASS